MESLLRDGIEALEKGAPTKVHQSIEIRMREEIARLEREVQYASARLSKLQQMRIAPDLIVDDLAAAVRALGLCRDDAS